MIQKTSDSASGFGRPLFVGLVLLVALIWWFLPQNEEPVSLPKESDAKTVSPAVDPVVQEIDPPPAQDPVVVIPVVNDQGPLADAGIQLLSNQEECPDFFESDEKGRVTIPLSALHCASFGLIRAPGHRVQLMECEELTEQPTVQLEKLGTMQVEVSADPKVELPNVETYLLPLSPSPVLTLEQVQAAWTLWITDTNNPTTTTHQLPIELVEQLSGIGDFPVGSDFLILPEAPALMLSTDDEGPDLVFSGLPAGPYRFQVSCKDSVTCTPSDEAQVAGLDPGGRLRVDTRIHRKPEFNLSGILEVHPGEIATGSVWVHSGILISGWLPLPTAEIEDTHILLRHVEKTDLNADGIADFGTQLRERSVKAEENGSFFIEGPRDGEKSLETRWSAVIDDVQHLWMAWRSFQIDGPGEYDLGVLEPVATPPLRGIIRIVDGAGQEIRNYENGEPIRLRMDLTTDFSPQNRKSVQTTLTAWMPFELHGLAAGKTNFDFSKPEGDFRGNSNVTIDSPTAEPLVVEFVKDEMGWLKVQAPTESQLRVHVRHPATGWSNSFLTLSENGISCTGQVHVPIGECHVYIKQYKPNEAINPDLFAMQVVNVTSKDAQAPNILNAQLQQGSAVSVLVYGPDGRQKQFKQVKFNGAGWERVWSGFTDEFGRAFIHGLPPGIEISCAMTGSSAITALAGGVIEMVLRYPR